MGLVCNFSGKLLTGAFLDKSFSFFYSRLAWRHQTMNFFPLYNYNKCFCIVLFSWWLEAIESYFVIVPEQSLKTVEGKGAVYQIRRPHGLAFVIYF
ncbi:MAG: hypothetical protein ACK56F_00750, partial [bacterium]